MKITKVQPITTNQSACNFRSLRVSYALHENLINTQKKFLYEIFESGKRLENTQYLDLLIKDDFTFQIKEKANPFFALINPIRYERTGEKQIKISGIYDGVDNEIHKKGETVNIMLDYPTEDFTNSVYLKLKGLRGILRVSYITKLLDAKKLLEAEYEPENLTNISKEKMVSLLMYKYGDIVK